MDRIVCTLFVPVDSVFQKKKERRVAAKSSLSGKREKFYKKQQK